MWKIIVAILSAFLFNSHSSFSQADTDAIRLIVRSDDMGLSHATNVGIMESYREGITTSVEIMVPTPWFPEAVQMLREAPDLDVGVHLVLTSEWTNVKWRPLTHVPDLTDSMGYFYPLIWPNAKYPPNSFLLEQNWEIEDIEKELRAQIELAQREIPQLSHLSAHMGCLQMNEETKALYRKLGEDYGLDIFLGDYRVERTSGMGGPLFSAEEKIKKFTQTLKELQPGTWILVAHPAAYSPEQEAIGHPGYEQVAFDRAGVLQVLIDQEVKALIKERGIELVSYADLKE